jgi:hypothetical protein
VANGTNILTGSTDFEECVVSSFRAEEPEDLGNFFRSIDKFIAEYRVSQSIKYTILL